MLYRASSEAWKGGSYVCEGIHFNDGGVTTEMPT